MAQGGYVPPIPPGIGSSGGGNPAGMNYRGAWTVQSYKQNDVVTHAGGLYIANQDVSADPPAFVAASTFSATSAAATPIPYPAGTNAGDLLVIAFAGPGVTSDAAAPPGFTVDLSNYDSTNWSGCQGIVCHKFLTAADFAAGGAKPGAAPGAGSYAWGARSFAFRGCDGVAAGTIVPATSSTQTTTPPAVTAEAGFVVDGVLFRIGSGYATYAAPNMAPALQSWGTALASVSYSGKVAAGYDVLTANTADPARSTTFALNTLYNSQGAAFSLPITAGGFPAPFFDQLP